MAHIAPSVCVSSQRMFHLETQNCLCLQSVYRAKDYFGQDKYFNAPRGRASADKLKLLQQNQKRANAVHIQWQLWYKWWLGLTISPATRDEHTICAVQVRPRHTARASSGINIAHSCCVLHYWWLKRSLRPVETLAKVCTQTPTHANSSSGVVHSQSAPMELDSGKCCNTVHGETQN